METVSEVRSVKNLEELRAEHKCKVTAAKKLLYIQEHIKYHKKRIEEHQEAIKDSMSQGLYSYIKSYAIRIMQDSGRLEELKLKEVELKGQI